MTEVAEPISITIENPEDEAPEENKEEGINVRISVFFDGTQNNRENIEGRLVDKSIEDGKKNPDALSEKDKERWEAFKAHGKKDNSYAGAKTNVAKMETYIDDSGRDEKNYILSTYIEGVGTIDFESDNTLALATGRNGLRNKGPGVKSKVEIGGNRLVSKLQKELDYNAVINKLEIDVFGFSRGAACARFFVHKMLNTENQGRKKTKAIAHRLRVVGFDIRQKNVEVKLVGLYDTVSSLGIETFGGHNDTQSIKLDSIKHKQVKKVVHLASGDEHRFNFALTNIASAGSKGTEIFLPGVHSDIGGGYRDGTVSDKNPDHEQFIEAFVVNKSRSKTTIEQDRNQLIAAGWYEDDEIWIDKKITRKGRDRPFSTYYLTVSRSNISHAYDKIPLHLMASYAREAGMEILDEIDRDEEVPADLKHVQQDIMAYASQGNSQATDWLKNTNKYPWLKRLRHDYLHYSANLTGIAGIIKANKPRFLEDKRQRVTHYG